MKKLNKILIIDGSYMLHRALHINEIFELKNSKGDRTGGVFQFMRTLNKEIKICGDYFPIVVFDNGLAERRVKADPNYKHAEERALQESMVLTPEEVENDYVTQYRIQRNKLSAILPYFGIPVIKIAGWEGDDLMYILSKLSKESLVLTDDRDLLQLLSESCKIRRPMAEESWDLKKFLTEYGFDGITDFIMQKAIIGDGSDNIPTACPRVGGGTVINVIKLLKKYGFENYPRDEKSLREICKSDGLKYSKAYLNLNRVRYGINLELVDLYKVKISPQVRESIMATIENSPSELNYFNAMKALADNEIREFSADELIVQVKMRLDNLWREE